MIGKKSLPLILIAGGKGGVGKSTLAVNLALSAADSGVRTLLLDLDLGLGDVPLLLGLNEREDLGRFLRGECELADCIVHDVHGLDLLVAEQGDGRLVGDGANASERILQALEKHTPAYDLIIADAPSGIGPDVLGIGASARHVLVVTAPEPTSMTDAYGFVKAMDAEAHAAGVDLPTPELFVNLASDRGEARRTAEHLSQVAQRFLSRTPRFAGWLPRARTVARAVARQEPFILAEPKSLASRLVSKLRERLVAAHINDARSKANV